ncbi:MAG: hypothetical protein VX897_07835 [Actinomycetota bacterium]|nr:hypothetical protein [Actinomycetota bacterium]
MSIPVSATDVVARLAEYGSSPFLVTASPDGTSKVVQVAILWDVDGAAFHCAPGAGTLRNLSGTEGEPATLVFPGPDADTHSWLVDTAGRVDPDDDGWAILTYESGVLHRPAPGAPGDQRHC